MAKDAVVPEELAKKFSTEKDTPYLRWVRGEGLDIISAHYVSNLRTVELKPWARRGGRGVYINHEASRTSNDCYVCEIPPGKKLEPQRQLFEEMILVLDGRGSTTVWNDEGRRITFEWKAGAMFAIPLNCWHQHFNGSGQAPARYVAVTNAPPVINLYEDVEFVFNTKYDFKNRFNGEPDYFNAKGEQKGLLLVTNFVADAVNLPLIAAKDHGPGAHVIILSGEGYSLMWPEGDAPKRYDWEVGTLIVPPNMWFHQHFNAGTTPARYLAFKHEGVAIRNVQGVPRAWISRRLGGDQIDYADEMPSIRKIFADELVKHGLSPRMDQAYAQELADLPPPEAKTG